MLDYSFEFDGKVSKASDYISYINGEAYLNQEKLNELTEEQQKTVRNELSTMVTQMNAFAAKTKEITDQITDSQKVLGESFIEQQTKVVEERISLLEEENKQLEEQIEAQEKLKEQYQETWDTLDKLEEEQVRQKSKEDIIKQLTALEGGSDSATNALRKDLISQLEDLQEEEREAAKQEARDALTKSIDDHIGNIEAEITKNDGILDTLNAEKETIENGINSILTALYAGSDKTRISQDEETGEIILELYVEEDDEWKKIDYNEIPKNANGGLVDYTGLAWVDGTTTNPEAFLSADDTKNMRLLLDALQQSLNSSMTTHVDNNDIDDKQVLQVSIGTVDVHTNELNNNQDFADASQVFATEFANAIQRRGLNLNVKK